MPKKDGTPTAKERKAIDQSAQTMLTDMIQQVIDKSPGAGIGFDVVKLKERIEEAQEFPTAKSDKAGRPQHAKINLIELFLAKAHYPQITCKELANYFGANEQNVKVAIRKYGLDTKDTLEKIKSTVVKFAALPIREEFKASVNLHHETEEEIKTINLTLKTLRDPASGLLYKTYLDAPNSDYYIKALKEAESKKIKLLQVITNMRSKALQYFEYENFITNAMHIVTKHAGIAVAQLITHDLENFLDIHAYGTQLPKDESPKQLTSGK